MKATTSLRQLLAGPGLVVAPGAYDCITARLIENAGFPAVYMTGSGTAATLGFPDYGLTTMTEMVANAGRIADVVRVPVIADADTGFGNELNVVRTVRAYEKAGVAAMHIEDQTFPKKCGHLDRKQVISTNDYISKIRAALGERRDPEFVIIARTDSRAVIGFDDAIERANLALEAGADIAFVEAPETMDEIEQIPRRVNGPCLFNLVHRGKSPEIDFATAESMGYRVAIIPGLLIGTVIGACENILELTKKGGAHPPFPKDMSVRERFNKVGAIEWDEVARKYSSSAGEA
jgi:2-methylisocitrate lyase-like PEP mutase family enzyme